MLLQCAEHDTFLPPAQRKSVWAALKARNDGTDIRVRSQQTSRHSDIHVSLPPFSGCYQLIYLLSGARHSLQISQHDGDISGAGAHRCGFTRPPSKASPFAASQQTLPSRQPGSRCAFAVA